MKKLLFILACGIMVAGLGAAEEASHAETDNNLAINISPAIELDGIEIIDTLDLVEITGGLGGSRRVTRNTAGGGNCGGYVLPGHYNDGSGHFTVKVSKSASVRLSMKPSIDAGIDLDTGRVYVSAKIGIIKVKADIGYSND